MINDEIKKINLRIFNLQGDLLRLRNKIPLEANNSHLYLRSLETCLGNAHDYAAHAVGALERECPKLMQIVDKGESKDAV